ncbi:MAG: hypothetical protein LBU37_02770 [Tannerellaceae bacterium]|jgi:hypothetical protein|nr:hypothetical protein [Tannerellaceae bacterium]
MQNTINHSLSALLIIISSLWISGCHVDELDFETENKFYLNALSHEFDVKTKQDDLSLNMIYIDGRDFWLSTVIIMPDTTIYHNDYSVKYAKGGSPQEVIGKWFTIKRIDDYTVHVSVDENNSDKDRSLDIQLYSNKIGLQQAAESCRRLATCIFRKPFPFEYNLACRQQFYSH